MGSRARFNYSVMGDTVNQASRIETACRHVAWDILVSDDVAREASDLAFLPGGSLELKGVSARLPVHVLVGGAGIAGTAQFRAFRAAWLELIAALSRGAPGVATLAQGCAALGEGIDPGLRALVERAVARPQDFAPRETAQDIGAAGQVAVHGA
jgi:adenylate cyclase